MSAQWACGQVGDWCGRTALELGPTGAGGWAWPDRLGAPRPALPGGGMHSPPSPALLTCLPAVPLQAQTPSAPHHSLTLSGLHPLPTLSLHKLQPKKQSNETPSLDLALML